jgi:hypothetical protein
MIFGYNIWMHKLEKFASSLCYNNKVSCTKIELCKECLEIIGNEEYLSINYEIDSSCAKAMYDKVMKLIEREKLKEILH